MKKILLFLMFALFCIPWAANAQETLTVCEGTENSSVVPFDGWNADAAQHNQMIFPAADLTAMNGKVITQMVFYVDANASNGSNTAADRLGTWTVSLGETTATTLTALDNTTTLTQVYQGYFDCSTGTLTLTFDNEYTYHGGNLLVDLNHQAASWNRWYFLGVNQTTNTAFTYGSARQFLPKTTFTYVPASSCTKPTDLTCLYTEGETTATVSWTSDAGAFNVDVNGTITAVTTNTYTINIQPATTYTIKVQANCGEEQSGWASTSFFSGCPASFAIPYTYGFENAEAFTCWTVNATGDYSASTGIYTGYPKTGTNSFRFFYTEEPGQYLISPELSGITNGLHVEFWYRQYENGAETFHVGYSTTTNDVDAFTWGEEISASTTYQRFSANYPAGTKYVAVKHTSDDQYYLYLDDFLFEESASCLEPTNVHYADATTTSASISWTPGASETAWDIYVTDDEDDVPGETTSITITNVEDNPYTLTNLTPATTYYVYVRALCGETDASAWSSPVVFDTKCEAMELPYSEDFLSSDSKWICWNTIVSNTSYDGISIVGLSNPAINVIQFYRGAQGGNIVAVLPEVDAAYPLNGYQITFDAAYYNYSGTLTVGVMTDPTDASTFEEVEQVAITDAYSTFGSHTVRLNTYTGNGQYIALKHAGTSTSSYIFVGNIEVTELPACLPPENLTVTGAKNAVISWEGEGSFEIALSLDSEVAPGDAIVAQGITANEYDLSTLTTEGMHYVYVRNNCGEAGYSEWVSTSFDVNYCTPNPTSHDGSGITGVSFGTGDNVVTNGDGSASLPASAPYYGDYTSMIGAVQAGVESTIAITTGTGSYPYTFVIWVDLDNSMSFEDSEILYIGKAASGSGTLNATITIPATQTLGDYRMRIYGADSYFSSFYGNGTTNWNAAHDPCSSGTYRHAHDYTLRVLEAPSCLVAGNVAVATENITPTTAVISWINNNGAEATYTVMQGETVLTTNAVDSYTLTGLTAATTYPAGTFTIISGCDETAVANVPAFTTACDAVTTFPWSEDFESYSAGNFNVPCWVNEHISGTGTQIFKVYTSTNGNNTTHQLQLPDMSSGTMTKLMLPEMTLPGNDYLFSIDVYRNISTADYGEGIRVFVSTDGEIEGATELAFISRSYATSDGNLIPAESASGWYTYELPIGISGTCYIILRGESKYGSSTYMDNFAVKQIPTCLKPTALECTATTTTTATFSWTNGAADQTAWQICLNGDETNLIMANSNPFTVEGLTVATNYTAKVRAYCGEDSQSEWSNEVSFSTACEAVTTFPWTENFESMTESTVPQCWDNSASTASTVINTPSYVWGVYAYNGNQMLRMYNYYVQSGTALINSPNLTLPAEGVYQLTFDYSNRANCGALTVKISEDGGTTFTDLQSYAAAGSTNYTDPGTFTEAEPIILADYAGKTVMLQFFANANYGSGAIFVDNIVVEEAPSCVKPNGLAATATSNSANLSWTANSEETAWTVYYKKSSEESYTEVDVTTNPYTLEGLTAATAYEYYVVANCSETEQSEASAVYEFTTGCEVHTLPYTYGFEDAGEFSCWTMESCHASTGISSNAMMNGVNGFSFRWNSNPPQYLISPEFEGTTAMDVSFYYKNYGESYPETFQVGYSTTDNAVGSFTWGDEITANDNTTWKLYEASFPAGTKYVAVKLTSNDQFYLYLDDFTFQLPCGGIVLNESNPTWSENFDNITESTAPKTGVSPRCWSWINLVTVDVPDTVVPIDTVPFLYYGADRAHSGSYSLRSHFRGINVMPVLDEESVDIQQVKLGFWVKQPHWFYPMQVGVMTDPEDASTFVPVAYVDNGHSTDYRYYEINFAGYTGEGRYIAFKHIVPDATSRDIHSVNFIDDITLSLIQEGECTMEWPYTENFDDLETAPLSCWELVNAEVTMRDDKLPMVYNEGTNYSLQMADRCVYALPLLPEDVEVTSLQLSMDVRQPNVTYQLEVGVWDGTTFEPVALVNNSVTDYVPFSCDFSRYAGEGRRIAFRNTLNNGVSYNYSYNYIDNIELTTVAACAGPVTLPYEQDFESFALSTEPTCWELVDENIVTMRYDKYPQVCSDGGDKCLRLADRCVYALPEIPSTNSVSELTLELTVRQPNVTYQLEVGVWDGTTFEPVKLLNNTDLSEHEATVDFSSYDGEGRRIALRNTLNNGVTYSYSYNYIDEINLHVTGTKSMASGSDEMDAAAMDSYLNNIAVYPNPTTGVLHIDAVDVEKVECYSQMGQLVGVYDNVNELNISELANGVYMLRITVPQGVTMRKVVKR